MTATKLFPSGAWEVSDIIDDHLVRRVYYGMSKREALAAFRRDHTKQTNPKRRRVGGRQGLYAPVQRPGKFEGETRLAEILYDLLNEGGADDEMGDAQDFGFYALFDGVDLGVATRPHVVYAILSENAQGFVGVQTFTARSTLRKVWRELEKEYEQFIEAEE